jgi:hypothetical protein
MFVWHLIFYYVITTNCNYSYRHVNLFNESNDKFGKLNKDCWTSMFDVECIVKSSILKIILFIDVTIFFNNLWIINFNIKFLLILTSHVKNKYISVWQYNYFLCITSSNINFCSSFNCVSKLWYSSYSIIMEYEIWWFCNFWFDPLCDI